MKSSMRGKRTSSVEVQGVLKAGVWLLIRGREHFIPFAKFPWFRKASLADIQKVQLLHGRHLYWPKLDVDLDLESLEHPEHYPMLFR